MEREQTDYKPRRVAAPSHIIERPRLIKLMEESGARVIVLNAPAGYGKTTLARQWLAQKKVGTAWYRCTSSSTDVAALTRSMQHVLDTERGELTEQVVQRIAASTNPEADSQHLAQVLVEGSGVRESVEWIVN